MALRHLNLRFRPHDKKGIILSFPVGLRLVFFSVFVLALVLSLLMYSLHFVAITVMAVSLIAAVYREDWILDTQKSTLTKRIGFLWPYFTKTYLASELLDFVIEVKKKDLHLVILLSGGGRTIIDSCETKNLPQLEKVKIHLQSHFGRQK